MSMKLLEENILNLFEEGKKKLYVLEEKKTEEG